jgi:hypothetical protein
MLSITYIDPSTKLECHASWHVGQAKPISYDAKVVEIQADGHEGQVIWDAFQVRVPTQISGAAYIVQITIPWASNPVQRWFGDHAQFIAHNLKYH